MKRVVLLVSGCLLLAGCAHQADNGGGGYMGAGGYPYAGLTDCSGYVYGYDPYVDAPGFGEPCRNYENRYYGYPYSYSYASQLGRRQQITAAQRSNHPRVVAPRGPDGYSAPSSESSAITTTVSPMRAPVEPAASNPPATHTVPPRK